jgi:putative tryptophan/tyrosine transport system substrate-binding protein
MSGARGQRELSRRRFMQGAGAVGLALLAGCGSVGTQAPSRKMPQVGVVGAAPSSPGAKAFIQGLGDHGWADGQNLVVRWGAADPQLTYAEQVRGLLAVHVDVLVTIGGSTPAARRVTEAVPIVMVNVVDPVEQGLIASLAHPGGNVTGVYGMGARLSGKRLELLKETIPDARRVGVLWSGTNEAVALTYRETEAAAQVLQLELYSLGVQRGEGELLPAFRSAAASQVDGLLVLSDVMMRVLWPRLATLAIQYRLPTMFPEPELVATGGLMGYGPNLSGQMHRAAYYVDRILKGAQPADLPVEQPMTFEFVINLKTAQALGLTIPPHVLLQATEVIQ